jgi:FkbM family methyltransferase
LNGLDTKLHQWIDTSPSYYVEIGANDGVAQSNTLSLELFYGWEGLLIEPVSATFTRLQKNRSRRRNFLLRAACVSFEHSGNEVLLHYANLMSVAEGLDSDIKNPLTHAEEGKQFLEPGDNVRTEKVPSITMTDALESAGAPLKIGFLSLDVEGAELEVLRGIDFERFRIESILVESRRVERITRFLGGHGYELRTSLSEHDYLFQLR